MTTPSTARKAGPLLGTGSQTAWPFTFKVFATGDIKVVTADSEGVETVCVLDTDYTVTLNANQETSPGGTVTYPVSGSALPVGSVLSIVGDLDYDQGLDLPSGGSFSPTALENQLDRTTMQIQQLKEAVDRAAKLPVTNSTDADALAAALVRVSVSADNIDTVVANVSSITTVASDLNEPVSEINTVATAIANVDTVGANIANVNTVAGISANVTSVAGNATNINAVVANATNINTVAGISANVTSVAGNATNINAVASNATNINAAVSNSANINAVVSNSANINAVAGNGADIDTVAANIAAVNTAATNIAAIIAAPSEAAAAAASAAAAAASVASGMYSSVQDKSTDYTVVAGDAGDLIRVTTTGGARTITLPAIATQVDGFKVAVAKWSGDANAVTVARASTDTINGSSTYVLDAQYKSATFVADLETGTWFAAGAGGGGTNVVVDIFSDTGAQTAFTLSGDPGSENNTQVFISGVYQQKDRYTVVGTTLTFGTAPISGTSNIEVVWSTPLAIGTPADGTVGTTKIADKAVTLAKVQDIATATFLGRTTAGTGAPEALTSAQATTLLDAATASARGTVELATTAETQAGTDATRAVTPEGLAFSFQAVEGAFKKLALSANGTSANVTVTADEIVVQSSSNQYKTLRAVSLTIAGTTTGANALDAGTIAANTWYSVWVMWNGTATAGILSTSATAPTLSSGYTHKARVGWIRTDGTANKYPLAFKQFGRRVQ